MPDDSQVAKYATISDVADELGEDIVEESARGKQIQRWLNRAERNIRARVTELDNWAAADADYKASVNDVEVSAVERKARNPDGMRSMMTQIDDGNFQQTVDNSRSTGEIVILDSEWSILLKSASTTAFSVIAQAQPDAFPLPSYPYGY
ncbi:Gp19/Gp15/Gp42 family protein [Bifidobacterium sp.]|jgi:DNA polymerase III delta prime subunit|uniref:Gp19/Gp15/Gp42 family protein n=1 Tax=Bifidobacterium sp. TaxID=41200 RepID=UPI0025C585F2|nr:Gp19/Gp15/Gp42 family protein [Bifidobacterium sp.]MCI1635203.1 phage Gp19/Gp15/Gp42 family protein [Bifidobacterium sp.]